MHPQISVTDVWFGSLLLTYVHVSRSTEGRFSPAQRRGVSRLGSSAVTSSSFSQDGASTATHGLLNESSSPEEERRVATGSAPSPSQDSSPGERPSVDVEEEEE